LRATDIVHLEPIWVWFIEGWW